MEPQHEGNPGLVAHRRSEDGRPIPLLELADTCQTMRGHELRRCDHPDLSYHVIHFVGRLGKANDRVPLDVATLAAPAKLSQIFETGIIRAFPVFFGGDEPVVCFTECTPAGVQTLIRERRYSPWGIAFMKDFVFSRGGPTFYVRGDEWKYVESGFPRGSSERGVRSCGQERSLNQVSIPSSWMTG